MEQPLNNGISKVLLVHLMVIKYIPPIHPEIVAVKLRILFPTTLPL